MENNLVKNFILTIICILLSGCVVLRYRFEQAINNLPPGSKLISVGNYSITYKSNNVTYKSRYWPDGSIYKTEVISQ